MPADLPLFTVITQVVTHTPLWVWSVLALLVVLGLRQAFETVVPRLRLMLMPVAMSGYSLYGASATFGLKADVVAAWAVAMAAVAGASLLMRPVAAVRIDGEGRFTVPGSWWPLALMLSVFALRYVGTVSMILHPQWAGDALFRDVLVAGYGALSGAFAGRAWRTLRSGQPAVTGLAMPERA